MSKWQPIETAPKDETVVALKAIWNGQILMPSVNGKWSTDKTRNGGPGLIRDGWVGADDDPFAIYHEPTHWMPSK